MSEVKNESRNQSLDGVRAIACISVFCVHFMQVLQLDDRTGMISIRRLLEYGYGVSAFIIISGALIERDRSNCNRSIVGLVDYLWKKLVRISPMYYTTMFCIVFVSSLSSSGIGRLDILSHALFLHNLSDRFLYSISPPFWYLGVQMQAYLVVSLIVMILPIGEFRKRARSLLLIFIAIICWLAYGSLIFVDGENNTGHMRWLATNPMAVRHSVVAHLPNFLLAMAFSQQVLNADVLKFKHRIGNDIIMVLLLAAMAWIGLSLQEKDITYWNGRYCFPFLPIPLIYLIALCSSGFMVSSILSWKPLVWVGTISFPFYLVHHFSLCGILFTANKTNIILDAMVKNTIIFFAAFGVSLILAFLLKQMNHTIFISLKKAFT
jgi:peptidoglycan/LPS O-acetylase OafA/YrhL